MLMILAIAVVLVATAIFFYFWITPAPIDAAAWSPPPARPIPRTGTLDDVQPVTPPFHAPESIVIAADGTLYASAADDVYRQQGDRRGTAETGGRPLGLALDATGGVLVANHPLGLQRIDARGNLTLLAAEAEGTPIRFANAVLEAPDGTIYLTESSTKFNQATGFGPPWGAFDMLEARPHGRLIRHEPETGRTTVVLQGLHFPNGLALSADGSRLFIAETFRHRLLALDLSTGELSVFLDALPGYPDNLARDPDTGLIWIAMGIQRGPWDDWIQQRPFLKNQLTKLPRWIWEHPTPRGLVVAVDERGHIRHALEDATGRLGILTTAYPHGDGLYLGSLKPDTPVLRLDKPR